MPVQQVYKLNFNMMYINREFKPCFMIFAVVSPAQGSVAESVTRVHNKELEMSEKWRKILEKGPEPRVLIEPLGSQSQIISPSLKPPPPHRDPKEPKAVVLLEPLDEKVSIFKTLNVYIENEDKMFTII